MSIFIYEFKQVAPEEFSAELSVIFGERGDQGEQGIQGEKGDQGDQGIQGIQGIQGLKGDKGDTGDQGIQGIQGIKGDKGDTGDQGIQGEKGDTGDQGIQGIQGLKGDKGDKGEKGDTGERGLQGLKGDTGATGAKGDKGDTGTTNYDDLTNKPDFDARYAGRPYAVMAKAKFASLASSYGMLGKIFGNSGYLNDLQVYGESTQASVPTPDVPVPIVSTTGNVTVNSRSKNLITSAAISGTQSGITFTVNADKSITMVGTATAAFTRTIQTGISLPAATTLTISGVPSGSLSTYHFEVVYKRNGADNYPKSAGNTQTFTTVEDNTAAFSYVSIKSGTVINATIYPQVEVGSVATSYEMGQTSTQTLPLGTTQLRSLPNGVSDRIYKSGGSWFLEQNVGFYTLTGGATFPTTLINGTQFNIPFTPNALGGTDSMIEASSNRFIGIKRADRETVANSIYSFPAQPTLRINTTIASDTTTFNAWLATNQPVIQYILATPITTTITDPTLIAALENIRTYQGITNITASTPVSGSYGTDVMAQLNTKVNKAGDIIAGTLTTQALTPSNATTYNLGAANNQYFSAYFRQMFFGSTNASLTTGTGFPNGAVSAPVGSIYIDTAVTNGASSWIKKSGTGNTGWQILEGDTGWRTIVSWDSTGVVTGTMPGNMSPKAGRAGDIRLRRRNSTIEVYLREATFAAGTVNIASYVGFRSSAPYFSTVPIAINTLTTLQVGTAFYFIAATAGSMQNDYGASAFFETTTDWPTTLPGTAA